MMEHQANPPLTERIGGHWVWRGDGVRTRIFLVGRGPETRLMRILPNLPGSPRRAARLRQVHSSTVIQAAEGTCGQADALFTGETGLALGVATADCLPIVLSGPRQSAAIHAGWRGLAGGIILRTVERLVDSAEQLAAWIGPGIGPCCYEVGQDVADRVAEGIQLSAVGVQQILSLSLCTYCRAERLWSYRREGPGAGRNWTLAWRTPTPACKASG